MRIYTYILEQNNEFYLYLWTRSCSFHIESSLHCLICKHIVFGREIWWIEIDVHGIHIPLTSRRRINKNRQVFGILMRTTFLFSVAHIGI